ncbi:MAG TPA: hypothetical protein VN982_16720 [Candidatus Dormibacteraeota bacterium]|nr:hypothetical protein [Candidatus Dormibacteraeota bacterium]
MPKPMGEKLKISPRSYLLLAGCAMLWSTGCPAERHTPVHWQTAVLVRPTVPEYKPTNEGEEMPDLQLEIPATPKLASVRMVPARPRVPVSQPAESSAPVARPQEPIIAPQLSAEETEAARRITQQSLDVAERNLSATQGRTLNAMQSDLASKVRGFMDDAKEAIGNVDWTRARILANKAEVLSKELARTL